MEFKYALFTVLLVAALKITSAQNYCSPSLCNGRQHIACNNNGNFAARCTNPSMVQLTQAQRNIILRIHNQRRNRVAGGLTKLSAACRMGTMQWDNELARIAAFNVRQCQMRHDACRNTNTYSNSGQNLAMITSTGGNLRVPQLLRRSVNLWFNEIRNVRMTQINSYPSGYNGPAIGHFTEMVREQNIRIGCAASTFRAQGANGRSFLLACNYATTNIINQAVYSRCPTAASGCTTGRNPNFPNLCSRSEAYSL